MRAGVWLSPEEAELTQLVFLEAVRRIRELEAANAKLERAMAAGQYMEASRIMLVQHNREQENG